MIENLLAVCPAGTKASFYRTAAGAEIDLVIELSARDGVWAIEIKRSASAGLQKGNHHALADIARRYHSWSAATSSIRQCAPSATRSSAEFIRNRL